MKKSRALTLLGQKGGDKGGGWKGGGDTGRDLLEDVELLGSAGQHVIDLLFAVNAFSDVSGSLCDQALQQVLPLVMRRRFVKHACLYDLGIYVSLLLRPAPIKPMRSSTSFSPDYSKRSLSDRAVKPYTSADRGHSIVHDFVLRKLIQ